MFQPVVLALGAAQPVRDKSIPTISMIRTTCFMASPPFSYMTQGNLSMKTSVGVYLFQAVWRAGILTNRIRGG